VHWKNTYIDMQVQWELLLPAINAGVFDLCGLILGYAKLFEVEVKSRFKTLGEDSRFAEALQRGFGLSSPYTRATLASLIDVLRDWRKSDVDAAVDLGLRRYFDKSHGKKAAQAFQEIMKIRNLAAHQISDPKSAVEAREVFLDPIRIDALLSFLTPSLSTKNKN